MTIVVKIEQNEERTNQNLWKGSFCFGYGGILFISAAEKFCSLSTLEEFVSLKRGIFYFNCERISSVLKRKNFHFSRGIILFI